MSDYARVKTWTAGEILTAADLNAEFENVRLNGPPSHEDEHITGGADELDGDQLDIDWNPTNYTPATTPSEVTSVDHLTAHLYGVDQKLGTLVTEDTNLAASIAANLLKHAIMRSRFTYNGGATAYTIKVGGGRYICKDKYCYWNSELTTNAIGSPSASTWYYLYLDYSAITSGTPITNSELIWSSTAPTYSHQYKGWYNGDDLCIFVVRINITPSNILDFMHDGGDLVQYANLIADFGSQLTTSPASKALTIPAFASSAQVVFSGSYSNAISNLYYAPSDKGDTNIYHFVLQVNSGVGTVFNTVRVFTDSSQQIEVWESSSSTNTYYIYTVGWYFPSGM